MSTIESLECSSDLALSRIKVLAQMDQLVSRSSLKRAMAALLGTAGLFQQLRNGEGSNKSKN